MNINEKEEINAHQLILSILSKVIKCNRIITCLSHEHDHIVAIRSLTSPTNDDGKTDK